MTKQLYILFKLIRNLKRFSLIFRNQTIHPHSHNKGRKVKSIRKLRHILIDLSTVHDLIDLWCQTRDVGLEILVGDLEFCLALDFGFPQLLFIVLKIEFFLKICVQI